MTARSERPPSRTRREARQAAQRRARADADARARRSQRRVLGGVIAVCLVAGGLAVAAAMGAGDGDEEPAASSTASSPSTLPGDSTTSFPQGEPTEVPTVAPGEAIGGETPCPAEDGSSARTTSFAGPPPRCIDPELSYRATVRTSEGAMTFLLSPDRAPEATNHFIVLARYHYFDGMAFDTAVPQSHVEFGGSLEGGESTGAPGYRLPAEVQETIYVPGTLGFVPGSDGTIGAELFVTTFEKANDLPADLTTFGQLLDGMAVLQALNRLATDSGQPSGIVTIEGIDVEALSL